MSGGRPARVRRGGTLTETEHVGQPVSYARLNGIVPLGSRSSDELG